MRIKEDEGHENHHDEDGEDFESHPDDILNAKLEEAFHKQTSHIVLHDVAKIAIEHDPIDLAHAVTRLPASYRHIVYDNLPDLNAKVIFMINTGRNTRAAIFRQINDQEIKRLIERMPPDEAVWVLDDMSDRRLKRILEILDIKKASRIRELQKHDRHSAGRLMTNEFFAFPMNATIGEVALQIRNNPGVDLTSWIFVLNDAGELIGYVPARNLIVNAQDTPIRQVARPILHKTEPGADRDEVVDLMERYKIPALPVVDAQEKLVGVIAYEDAMEAMHDIADETIASIAGTAEDISEPEPTMKRFVLRAPWLLVTLCAGLTTAAFMSHFEGRIWFSFVPFFVPLITGMSGNVGIQCSTILVRGMSTGELSPGSRKEALMQELKIGLITGIIFGAICGLLIYLLNLSGFHQSSADPVLMAIIVSCGVLGACLTATSLGTLSPFFFDRFNIDPAVASGPIVTAFNDVLSTLMYFLVAKSVSSFFHVIF
jgi:magnesium transporter